MLDVAIQCNKSTNQSLSPCLYFSIVLFICLSVCLSVRLSVWLRGCVAVLTFIIYLSDVSSHVTSRPRPLAAVLDQWSAIADRYFAAEVLRLSLHGDGRPRSTHTDRQTDRHTDRRTTVYILTYIGYSLGF